MAEKQVERIEKCLKEVVSANADDEHKWISLMDRLAFTLGAISYFQKEVKSTKTSSARLLAKAIHYLHQKRSHDYKLKQSWAKFVARMAFLQEKPKAGKCLLKILSFDLADEASIDSAKDFCQKIYCQDMKVASLPYWVLQSVIFSLDGSALLSFLKKRNASVPNDRSHDSLTAACLDAIQDGSENGTAELAPNLLEQLENAGATNIYFEFLKTRFFDEPRTDEEKLTAALSHSNIRFLPQKPEKVIVGRAEDLASVKRLLKDCGCVDIYGKRGIGKTSLALLAAHEVKGQYQLLVWLDASSTEHFQVSLFKLSAVALNLKQMSSKSLLPEVLRGAKEWLTETAKKGPVLVVFDGIQDGEILKSLSDFLPKVSRDEVHVLLTSTEQVTAESIPSLASIQTHLLDKLSDQEVKTALLNMHKGQIEGGQTEAATKIAKSLDGDPLLMTIVTSFITNSEFSFTMYWDYLQKTPKSLNRSSACKGAQYDAILSTIFDGFPGITRCVHLLAFCDAALIPADIFKYDNSPGDDNRQMDQFSQSKRRFESDDRISRVTLSRLARYGLIKWEGGDSFSLHTKLAKKLRDRQTPEQQIQSLKVLCEILKTAFSCCQSNWDFCSSLYPHALRCEEYMNSLHQSDAELLVQCGHMKSLLGHSREARKLLQKSLDCPEVTKKCKADALINLATVERRLGNMRLAMDCVRKAMAVLEDSDEEGSEEDLCRDEMNRAKEVEAEILMDAGNFGRALELLNEIKIDPDLHANDRAGGSALYANRARAHLGLDKFSDARDFYEKAKNLLNKGEHRFDLYQIYQHISNALVIKETKGAAGLAAFRKEVGICLKKVRKKLPSFHRYFAWGYRSVARLKLHEVHMIKASNESCISDLSSVDGVDDPDQMLNLLRDAFRHIRASLECHVEIGNGLHLAVAKACDLVGKLCIEWIESPKAEEKKTACECARAHFKLAAKILQPLVDERLPGIEKQLKEIRSSLKRKLIAPEHHKDEPNTSSILCVLLKLAEDIDDSENSS
eukprot:m.265689 g.265689  ORF g.265689 m.265689 type:complete len:1018 (+) comp40492_c0_seq6:52-3105(+)